MKKFLAPEVDLDTREYWAQLRQHRLRLQLCAQCDKFRFPPLPSCPYCGMIGGEWRDASGRGTLYTWTEIVHPLDPRLKDEVPFTMALVDLEEGPRIGGRLIGATAARLRIGMPVVVRFDDLDDELTLVNFQLS
jgi:uncharacterized OB-fold protein